MQHYAILRRPNSLSVFGINFRKGVQTPVNEDIAEALSENDRFSVIYPKEPVLVPAAVAVVVGQSVTPLASQPTSPPNVGKPPTKALRMKAIQTAAADLDITDEDSFTTDGRPSAVALTKKLGWQVTSQERDDAMRVYAVDKGGLGDEAPKKGGLTIRRRPGTTEPKLLDTGERDLVILPQTLEANGGNGLDGQAKPRTRSQAEIDAGALDGEGRREVFSATMLKEHGNNTLVTLPSAETAVPTVEDEHASRGVESDDSQIVAVPTTVDGQPASPDQEAAIDAAGAQTI